MKSFGVLSAVVFATSTEAYRRNSSNNHPFQGEHSEAHIIEGETRSTHRAVPVSDNNKYETLISKDEMKPRKTPSTILYESLFGESE